MKEEQAADRRSVFAMILAVGIRPCSGAVLVLLFSMSAGIFHWGILATLAMSLGTAITVAGLATVSVIIRDSSFLMGGKQSVWRQKLSRGFGFFAAIVLIIISISMIWSYSSNAGRVF
jgi:ABC-type nickel/cobalt efflux system permease component RcnA